MDDTPLQPGATDILAGGLPRQLEAWEVAPRRSPPPARTALPPERMREADAAGVRAELMGAPLGPDEREVPADYGPETCRLVDLGDGLEVATDRLSQIRRQYPDQMEARRRARAGVPLMGWPPRRMYRVELGADRVEPSGA